MTLKIKPHAVDQDSGTFIFPSVLVTDSIITGSVTVFDESVLMGQADAFNFAGDNVEAVMSGTTAHIMVTGTAGGGGGHETGTMVIYEENVFLGVFEEMRFIGDGVTALNSGSYAAIAITGTAGGGGHETGTMVVYDEGDFLGVFEEMRFLGDGVDAYNSGSYVAVSIPSGGGGGGGTGSVSLIQHQFVEGTSDITLGAAAWTDMTDMSITLTTDNNLVEVMFSAGVGNTSNGAVNRYRLEIDGAQVGKSTKIRTQTASVGPAVSLLHTDILSAGPHTIKAQWYAEAGTAQNRAAAELEHRQLSVKEFGLVAEVGASGGTPVSVTTGTFYVEELLYDVTLESSTGSVVFPDIPQDFDHLQIRVVGRSTTATTAEFILLAYNGDTTAANYRYANHHAGSAHGVSAGDDRRVGIVDGASASAGQYGLNIIEILDYAVTGTLVVSRTISGDRNSATLIYNRDLFLAWEKFEAVTRIDLEPNTNSFDVGSHFQLIGIKETALVTSVTGGGGHLTGTMVVYDEGDFLGVFEEMRFIGDGVTALNSGSYVAVNVPGGGARVYNSLAQTIATATWTVVTYDSESYDTDDYHSVASNTGRLTIPADGTYLVIGNVRLDGLASGQTAFIRFQVDGATVIADVGDAQAALGATRLCLSTLYKFTAGQYVETEVYQNSGGDQDVNEALNNFMIQRMN